MFKCICTGIGDGDFKSKEELLQNSERCLYINVKGVCERYSYLYIGKHLTWNLNHIDYT